jgi:creatinine amidohydrolase
MSSACGVKGKLNGEQSRPLTSQIRRISWRRSARSSRKELTPLEELSMAENILKLIDLSHPQLNALNREKAVIFIPISPIEEHGPHLPLGVDAFNARFFAQKLAERLTEKRPDWTVVLTPLLPLGTNVFKYIGSIYIRQRAVRDVVTDFASSLARYGFSYFVVFSFHGGPGHLVALEEASRKVSKKFGVKMISLTGGLAYTFLTGGFTPQIERHLSEPLTQKERELFKKDIHAGWWETAMMLKTKPHLVEGSYKELEPVTIDIRKVRADSAKRAGKGLGYLGAPHKATREFAEASTEAMCELGLSLVERLLDGEDVSRETTPKFYRLPIFRTNFKRYLYTTMVASLLVAAIVLWKFLF